MGVMNRILIIIGITTAIFISICLFFAWNSRVIPDSLIYGYFGAIGAEGFVMGWIKNIKQKGGKENDGD